MPWPLSAVNSGPRRLSQAHGITETCRNSQPTCSAASCSSPADRLDVQSQVKDNPRLEMAYRTLGRMDDGWRARIRAQAKRFFRRHGMEAREGEACPRERGFATQSAHPTPLEPDVAR